MRGDVMATHGVLCGETEYGKDNNGKTLETFHFEPLETTTVLNYQTISHK